MKAKPRGAKYRNLTLCGGVIYYERVVHKRRIRISTKTSSWDEAAAVRDLYEQRKGIGSVPFFAGEVPRFADFAKRYTAEDTARLAPTTAHDRKSYLREEGPLQRFFGARRLDKIDPPLLAHGGTSRSRGGSSRRRPAAPTSTSSPAFSATRRT